MWVSLLLAAVTIRKSMLFRWIRIDGLIGKLFGLLSASYLSTKLWMGQSFKRGCMGPCVCVHHRIPHFSSRVKGCVNRLVRWGCNDLGLLQTTDLAEEFRNKKQKFIEHPKVLSILALTSIKQEGKTMAKLKECISKQIAEANKGEKFTWLDTKVQQLDNMLKNMVSNTQIWSCQLWRSFSCQWHQVWVMDVELERR